MQPTCDTLETDVLIIGAGGAGCMAAMAAADAGARVLLLEKGRLGVSGATFDPFTADKGITVAAAGYNPTTDPETHYAEARAAGRGLAIPSLVRAVAYEAPNRFRELLATGVPFQPNRLEACFGKAMVGAFVGQRSLAAWARGQIACRSIDLREHTGAFALLRDSHGCAGAVAVDRRGGIVEIRAGAVILATGGASQIFRYNFNAPALTGDGLIMALEVGAELANLEFYQAILGVTEPARVFFPQWYLAGNPQLRNALGRAFLADYLPDDADVAEMVIARGAQGPFSSSRSTSRIDLAIIHEIAAGRGSVPAGDARHLSGVYCDFAALPAARRQELDLRSARPALAWLRARHIAVEERPVPVAPFAHAFNGGILIGAQGETGVPGLFACGETAAGPHGANRVGGHMFAVLLVFGHRAGRAAAAWAADRPQPTKDRAGLAQACAKLAAAQSAAATLSPHGLRAAVQQAMNPVMLTKDATSLRQALAVLATVRSCGTAEPARRPAGRNLGEAVGDIHLAAVADLVAKAALLREESRGAHYRADFPAERSDAPPRAICWRAAADGPEHRWRSLESEAL